MKPARRPAPSSRRPHARTARWRVGGAGLVALLLLGACVKADDQADQPTADDQRQLNEAATMLDANSVDANLSPGDNESGR